MFTVIKEKNNKLVINRSKFLGFVFYCDSDDKREELIKKIKKEHTSATHVCFAHIFFKDKKISSVYSDDREPSGTAGIPILNALKENELINVLCVVVRYFGGVKLGTQNLSKAYKDCSVNILNGNKKSVELKTRCLFECSYDSFNILCKKIKGLKSCNSQFLNNVKVDAMLTQEEISYVKEYSLKLEIQCANYC